MIEIKIRGGGIVNIYGKIDAVEEHMIWIAGGIQYAWLKENPPDLGEPCLRLTSLDGYEIKIYSPVIAVAENWIHLEGGTEFPVNETRLEIIEKIGSTKD